MVSLRLTQITLYNMLCSNSVPNVNGVYAHGAVDEKSKINKHALR